MKSSEIGKSHQQSVFEALKQQLEGDSIGEFNESTRETVAYIVKQYPVILTVRSKYETTDPDHEPDLLIQTDTAYIKINLFYIKASAKIQPKNPGAKSFLTKYFQAPTWQTMFNIFLEDEYKQFFKAIVETKEETTNYDQLPELKNKVKEYYEKFTDEINPMRRSFLFNIREHAFKILNEQQQTDALNIQSAYQELMLIDSTNIITRCTKEGHFQKIENWQAQLDREQPIQIYRKGNDSIGIRIGAQALTMRFKFESGPHTPLKLATSYDVFPSDERVHTLNKKSVMAFEKTIAAHTYIKSSNQGNAIGKCNEAAVYYGFVKQHLTIHQIEEKEFQRMLEKYSPLVPIHILLKIQEISQLTVQKIKQYLAQKYQQYEIEAIQLVPDSYIKDRLDTSDLHMELNVNGKVIDEYFSLKAAAKAGSRITMKNPGIGTILGTGYFGIGTMKDVVDRVKTQFKQGQLTHQQCLETVSLELGTQLKAANQPQLTKGLTTLFGNAPTVVTFYQTQQCIVKEHARITTEITVRPQSPTPINTLLAWNDNHDQITLRVKFGAGQSKGWSSLKLACEYVVRDK